MLLCNTISYYFSKQIPNVSPTNRWTTAIPLVFVLMVTALKEIFEDYVNFFFLHIIFFSIFIFSLLK